MRAIPEADLLFVRCAGRDGSAGGARERDQAQNEKRHGGHSRRGEERTEVERALISRAIHDWDSPATRSDGAFPAASTPPASLLDSEERQEADDRTQERGDDSCVQHLEHPAEVWHMQPQLAEELRACRTDRVDEVVVVSLEYIPIAVPGDDAVKHHGVEQRAPVSDDLADPVVRGGPYDREIACVEARLHAHPARDHVAGGPADVGRGEVEPRHARDDEDRERSQAGTQTNSLQDRCSSAIRLMQRGEPGPVVRALPTA